MKRLLKLENEVENIKRNVASKRVGRTMIVWYDYFRCILNPQYLYTKVERSRSKNSASLVSKGKDPSGYP